MPKALLIASVQSHICQFHRPHVTMLHSHNYEVHVAAHNNLDVKPGLKLDFADRVFEVPFSRSVFDKKNIIAYKQLKQLLSQEHYDIVQCNTPIASILARFAARKYRKSGTKVVYIAHGFQFFKGSGIKNWLLYYPIERIASHFTDLIFTINKEDYRRALGFHTSTVQYIPGIGVNTAKFREAEKKDIRDELHLPKDAFLILTVAELHPRKNLKTSIAAIAKLKEFPIYYVLFGNGILEDELKAFCNECHVADKVFFAGYRRDVPSIMKCCDLFLFPSKREGLGLAGIEAMASGLPVVSSNINGILDYMEQGKTGIMCDPDDVEGFANAILELYQDPERRKKIAEYNKIKSIAFDVSNTVAALEEGYTRIISDFATQQ
ncbi:MAG: glycosyltransferase family 4 protein [Oscillospiraceae bacterium]|nr:glycosyltransferase family 4 protein [Oscillospiraceae bacterium]